MNPEIRFSPKQYADFQKSVLRLQEMEPIQYILGEAFFDGLTLKIGPGVLVPRPETEELVDWAAKKLGEKKSVSILDVCTGSGCIALALQKRLPNSVVSGVDVSEEALNYARENAALLELPVTFKQADVFELTGESFFDLDAVVCNPPYIPDHESAEMSQTVLNFEPGLALFVPNHSPLLFYQKVSELALDWLKPGGGLWFEIHENFGNEMAELMKGLGYAEVEIRQDIHGRQRMAYGQKSG